MNNLTEIAQDIITKFNSLELALSNETNTANIISLSKKRSDIEEAFILSEKLLKIVNEINNLLQICNTEKDNELVDMAYAEMQDLKLQQEAIELKLKKELLPKNPRDNKNAIIEIRAGTGGDEAALFAADLFKMYQRFCENKNWKIEIMNLSEADLHGIKEISFSITGKNVFANLKYESGTHRVQRVPETENSGRLHTSAVTVAVFPEMDELDVSINPNDLKIDVYRSGGAGGQHVNKTESAVRITHLPTGLIVVQQDDRSQIKNREKGMKILRAKVCQYEEEKRIKEIVDDRRSQIGSGDRSEKIRTYNFPQNRLTDHRINFTSYNLEGLINEGKLDELIEALKIDEQEKILSAL